MCPVEDQAIENNKCNWHSILELIFLVRHEEEEEEEEEGKSCAIQSETVSCDKHLPSSIRFKLLSGRFGWAKRMRALKWVERGRDAGEIRTFHPDYYYIVHVWTRA